MKRPDAARHNPDPSYVRALIEASGLSQRAAARQVGIAERTMRYYVSGEMPIPYAVQYCLEALAKG